jgi:hypothetical protein
MIEKGIKEPSIQPGQNMERLEHPELHVTF